ncbi:hypothetical protein DFH07DRAFT_975205 [Mycena maculata]|uniref:Uncharacterized protein n=1 Tax=Mycena maculata TaxID=230809 RepID=A0AAD7P2E2_9AGAR|nr:hypothetical protein DFH07DRAFT_975205 [Mycena maculata]
MWPTEKGGREMRLDASRQSGAYIITQAAGYHARVVQSHLVYFIEPSRGCYKGPVKGYLAPKHRVTGSSSVPRTNHAKHNLHGDSRVAGVITNKGRRRLNKASSRIGDTDDKADAVAKATGTVSIPTLYLRPVRPSPPSLQLVRSLYSQLEARAKPGHFTLVCWCLLFGLHRVILSPYLPMILKLVKEEKRPEKKKKEMKTQARIE